MRYIDKEYTIKITMVQTGAMNTTKNKAFIEL